MNNNDKPNNDKGTLVKRNTSISSYVDVDTLEQIENLVAKLEGSTLAKQFIETTYPHLGEDGTPDLDKPEVIFNKADMILCLGLGVSFGMSPFVALSYGKALNLQAVKKIERGSKLGLDYATSLENIYVWSSGGKEIIYTSIHVINSVLSRIGVSRKIIQDGKTPVSIYTNAVNGDIVKYDEDVHKVIPRLSKTELDKVVISLKNNNLIAVHRKEVYIGEVELRRFNKVLNEIETISIPYSSQEAIDAGLLKGINSDGAEVTGKDNWNNHRATHLLKMSVIIGARMIAGDVLNGTYIPDEINISKVNINDDTPFTNIEEVQ